MLSLVDIGQTGSGEEENVKCLRQQRRRRRTIFSQKSSLNLLAHHCRLGDAMVFNIILYSTQHANGYIHVIRRGSRKFFQGGVQPLVRLILFDVSLWKCTNMKNN